MVLDLLCRSTLVLATTLQYLQLLSSHMQWFNILTNSCYLLTWTIEITPNNGLFSAFYIWNQIKWFVISMQQNSDVLWLPVSGGDTYLPFKPFSPKLDAPEKSDKLLVVLRFHLFLQWPACRKNRRGRWVCADCEALKKNNITNTTPAPFKKTWAKQTKVPKKPQNMLKLVFWRIH